MVDSFKLDWDDVLPGNGVTVTEDAFGHVGDTPVQRFTLSNGRVTAQVISVGAALQSVRTPDRNGNLADVVLGFDTPYGYLSPQNPNFGGTVGRVANRLANASFTLDSKEYTLYPNEGRNTLHGGLKGWDLAVWHGSRHPDGVTFTLQSPDGDEGFPGAVTAQVTYRLTEDSRLHINMQAMSSKPTPVAMLNHAYFNLGGHGSGAQEVYKTRLTLNSDRYIAVDDGLVATGEMPHVEGTPMDLRSPRLLGDVLQNTDFDRSFVVTRGVERPDDLVYSAGAIHEPSGRTLEVYSDQPSLHLYTCGKLPDTSGKQGATYGRHGGFTLEPQYFPNAVHNVRRFPKIILRPGSVYRYNMIYKFGVRKTTTASKYKLHYFDVTALGEPIRFLLAYGNLDWEDIRYDDAKWAEAKTKMPFGQMPILDVDGKIYAQSTAISRCLAKQVGLSGKDDLENLQIDMAVDLFHDFRQKVGGWFNDPIPESKGAKLIQLKDELPFYLSRFEQIVKENNGFLVNGKMTWADVYFVAPLKYYKYIMQKDFLEGYPLLQDLVKKVESTPAIASYIAQRPAGNR
ncbi:galactose mutarotase-like [Frankliniella occidentalis]|uniref:Galactose mutarotase n=1 Tax=Frankliniella occidentalis TaxID=133901 RepID=A0A6J1SSM3_FRAOC|nr:galactose mutarotase-like [Frankliniella occidentalis]